jgi:hypothetical protein
MHICNIRLEIASRLGGRIVNSSICCSHPALVFRYAKYLEVLSLPDDMRELLDEYLDANARAEQNKACEEFFQCPYSIKESMKKNADGNSL